MVGLLLCEEEMEKLLKPLIYGWGINDADYSTNRNYGRCPYFSRWHGVVERGHSETFKEKCPSTRLSSVNEVWKHFLVFKAWMETQIWEGLDLDKDILIVGNKEYGPEACAFVPQYINKLLNTGPVPVGVGLPIGVCVKANYAASVNIYVAQCRIEGETNRHVGRFPTPELAHAAWQLAKANAIESAISKYRLEPCFRQDVANALQLRADNLRDDHANNRETFSL
jgi:hypothetical protein